MHEFLRNLEKSHLLDAEQWAVVRRHLAAKARSIPGQTETPRDLAAWLVARAALTRWQADMLLAGKTAFFLGKYRLLDCIGTGGMGAVFKALHGKMGRTVAIKILLAEVMKNRDAVARFRHEIQTVAALDDPHIVRAYDAGSERGANYLVMEYVDGPDLAHLTKHNNRLPIDWACESIRQAALGLQHAHEQGLVHRDIKPANLLVTKDSDGRPLTKILDLGLARFVSEMVSPRDVEIAANSNDEGSLTRIGQFLGTPDYIAPEQARDLQKADIRSDLFSLGCTLFRLLTGEYPFAGESVFEKLEARQTTDARRARSLRSDIPGGLDDVIARMLARNPDNRYQTPREVADALAPFTALGLARAAPFTVSEARSRPPARTEGEHERLEQILRSLATEAADQPLSIKTIASRLPRPSIPKLIAGASVAVVVVAALLLWDRSRMATMIVNWPVAQREQAKLIVDGRTIRLPAQPMITVRSRAGTWALHLERDGFEPIDESRSVGRGEQVEFKPDWRVSPATARKLEFAALEQRSAVASRGDVLSSESAAIRRDLLAFDRRNRGSEESVAAQRLAQALRWPLDLVDGSAISAEERDTFSQFAELGSAATLVSTFGDSRLKFWNGVVAVAGGDRGLIAGAGLDGTVQVFETSRGRRLHTIVPPFLPTDLALSPDGEVLAIAGNDGSAEVWNVVSRARIATLTDTAAPIAFSHDGRLIAGRSARQEIALWDAHTGELQRTMQGHASGDLQDLSFSHNGKMLVSFGTDQSVLLWDVASGQERRRFPNSRFPRFSTDDAYLAAGTTNGDLVLWDTRTGETQRTFDDGGYPLAFRDGNRALVSKRMGRAILWNLESGEEIRTIINVPELAAVSPDGAWLAAGDPAVGELTVWNLQTGPGSRVINTAEPVTALAFTADSAWIVTGSKGGVVQLWSAQTGVERVHSPASWGPVDLSPDGRWLAARIGNQLERIDVTTGQSEEILAHDVADLEALLFSRDGKFLAGYGGWGFFRTSLRLWDVDQKREVSLAGLVSGTVRGVDFSGDSRLLAIGGDSRLVTVWNLHSQKTQYDLDDFTERVTALDFHPDGNRLAIACQDKTVGLWDLSGSAGMPLARPGGICHELDFHRDGNHLAGVVEERIVIWNVPSGKIVSELPMEGGKPMAIAWHPSGNVLAAAGDTGCIWLWHDLPAHRFRGDPARALRIGPEHGLIRRVLWSPEGRHLIAVSGNGTIAVLRITP